MICKRTHEIEVSLFKARRGGWAVGCCVEYEWHPSESMLAVTVLWWRLVIGWKR